MTYTIEQLEQLEQLASSSCISSRRLAKRLCEDRQTDPVDALKDAEILYAALNEIKDLMDRPDVSFRLCDRLREDFCSGNLVVAVEHALILLKASRQRCADVHDTATRVLHERSLSLAPLLEEKAKAC